MRLTDSEISALSCALDFLAHCDSYTYDTAKFSHNDVPRLAWAIESDKVINKRRDFRIALAAIDLSVHSVSTASAALEQVATVFPDLIPELSDALPLLEILRPRLAAHAAR